MRPTDQGLSPEHDQVRERMIGAVGSLIGTKQDLRIWLTISRGTYEDGKPSKTINFNIQLPGETSFETRILINVNRVLVKTLKELASFKVATIFTKEQFSEMIFKREVPEELADAVLQWNT